jgi:hypothetical protein
MVLRFIRFKALVAASCYRSVSFVLDMKVFFVCSRSNMYGLELEML